MTTVNGKAVSAWRHYKEDYDIDAALDEYRGGLVDQIRAGWRKWVSSTSGQSALTGSVASRFFQELRRDRPIPDSIDKKRVLRLLTEFRCTRDQDLRDAIYGLAFKWLVLSSSEPVQKLFDLAQGKISLLEYIAQIPEEELAGPIQAVNVLIEGIQGGSDVQAILRLFHEKPFLIDPIVKIMSPVPPERRKALLDLFHYHYSIQDIVTLIGNASPEKQLEALEGLLNLMKDGGVGDSGDVVSAIKDIPEPERFEVLSLVKPIGIDRISNIHRAIIIRIIRSSPAEDRQAVLDAILFLAKDFPGLEGLFNYDLDRILFSIFKIPRERRREVLSPLIELVAGVRDNDRKKIDGSSDALLKWFRSNPGDPELVHCVADFILPLPAIQELAAYHSFYHEVLMFAIASNKEDALLTNPYKVYGRLLGEKARLESLGPTLQQVDGQEVSIDLDTLRGWMAPLVVVLSKDLPQVPENSMQLLFERLEERLQWLPSETRAKALEFIDNLSYGIGIDSLADALNSGYLRGLLHRDENPEAVVDSKSAQFFAVMAHILGLRNTLEERELFSPQEETFLQIAASIQACAAAQLDGVNRVFLTLPNRPAGALDQKEYRLRKAVSSVVYKLFDSGDSPFLHELTNVPGGIEIQQYPHQVLYLKNLLASRLGLDHQLEFDLGTPTLEGPLARQTSEQVIECFERHFVREIVGKIEKSYISDLVAAKTAKEESKKNPHKIVFNELVDHPLSHADHATCWNLSDPEKPKLTRAGALELLIRTKLLNRSLPSRT